MDEEKKKCQHIPLQAQILAQLTTANQNLCAGLLKYNTDFIIPLMLSAFYFQRTEAKQLISTPFMETIDAYSKLSRLSWDFFSKGSAADFKAISTFFQNESTRFIQELFNNPSIGVDRQLANFSSRQAALTQILVQKYPEAILAIEPEFGFHFERGQDVLVDETDRFYLYQINPTQPKTKVKKNGKPVIILPPYVLGANILSFLPKENLSYAHAFANQGIPTYIRIQKSIKEHPAVQIMSGEDDVRDTRQFIAKMKKIHGRLVTINGYCQGGFSALCSLLTGKLDGLVDALITCVSPMDGTRSIGLRDFLHNLPQRFNNLAYGTKTLDNGNQVADGLLMGWVYKLKSIDRESPVASYFRDLTMFAKTSLNGFEIPKTAAAINYWLAFERSDLPLKITDMSFKSYNYPITPEGILPITLFSQKLDLKRLKAKNISWLICYGEKDDLVEQNAALAPLDHVEAEVTKFPKGHVAIATSWSNPNSACALHKKFGKEGYRGPVRYQLDLDDTTGKV